MKILFFIIPLLLCVLFCNAQPSIQWQKSLGGSGDDWANAIQQAHDSGYIIAGYSDSNDGDVTGHHGSTSDFDEWIVKTDGNGTIQWQKSLGGVGDEEANAVMPTTDGGYIIAGVSDSSDGDVTGNHGNYDYWIVKLDNLGSIQWENCFGGSDDDEAYSIQQTYDGGYIVAGASYSIDSDVTVNFGNYDYWIVKLQSNGDLQWQKSYGGSNDDEAYSIQQTTDSGYIIAGASASNDTDVTGNHGGYDYWILKITSSGSIQWEKSYGGSGDDFAYSVEQTKDGGYIVAGYSTSTDGNITGNHGDEDFWIIKLNASGTLQWQQSLGGTDDDEAYSIQQTADKGYIAGGYTFSNNGEVTGNHGLYDYWAVKIDSMGTIQWQRCLGGTSNEFATSIIETNDGGYAIAGSSTSSDGDVSGNHGGDDFWIVKLYSLVGIEEYDGQVSDFMAYPNPASTYINLNIPFANYPETNGGSMDNGSQIVVKITDITGRLIHEENLKGQATTLNIYNLPQGIYYISVNGDKFSSTKKIVKVNK